MSLSVISIPPSTGKPPVGLMVALHGWGANAEDLASLVPFLNLPNYHFLFPNAPFPHPQVWGGKMWYDFQSEDGLLAESQQILQEWLISLEYTTGVPLSRTILSGFSQGGAMTLDVGLNLPLAALIVLSGYLHPLASTSNSNSVFPPVLIAHGKHDTVVPVTSAQTARDTLLALGISLQYQEFNMQHEITPEVLEVMRIFIKKNT